MPMRAPGDRRFTIGASRSTVHAAACWRTGVVLSNEHCVLSDVDARSNRSWTESRTPRTTMEMYQLSRSDVLARAGLVRRSVDVLLDRRRCTPTGVWIIATEGHATWRSRAIRVRRTLYGVHQALYLRYVLFSCTAARRRFVE